MVFSSRHDRALHVELMGDLHHLRIGTIIERLEHGPLDATVYERQRWGERMTFQIDGQLHLRWWSYWRHDVDVVALHRLYWHDQIGWAAHFEPAAGFEPASPAFGVNDGGRRMLRLFAYRVEVHPRGAAPLVLQP